MTLFPPDDPPDVTLSVTQLHDAINRALRKSFPDEVWVRGEVHRVSNSRRGHTYFELVERKRAGVVQSTLDVALLEWNRAPVDAARREVGVELAEGIEVRIRGRVGVYARSGRLQFEMTAIDPEFTLGRLAADRDRLLRVLGQEGLLGANRSRVLPPVPLRVGIVASVGSAGYHDFVQELRAAPFGWRIETYDVRVQGRDAPGALVHALRTADGRALDVITLIRGGGARSELAVFDAEPLARTIATMTTPVLTGIGHETDRSVADEVAYGAFKTPTAVAQALVGRAQAFADHLAAAESRLLTLVPARLGASAARLDLVGTQIQSGVRRHLALARRQVDAQAAGVALGAARIPDRSRAHQERARARIEARAPDILRRAAARVEAQAAQVRALDPQRVLARGYSITRTDAGTALRDPAVVSVDAVLTTQLARGQITSRVTGTHRVDAGTDEVRE